MIIKLILATVLALHSRRYVSVLNIIIYHWLFSDPFKCMAEQSRSNLLYIYKGSY